jgi:hypothetical protein
MPKTLADVTLTSVHSPGNVTVSTTVLSMNPIVFEITATLGTVTRTERHTIGAEGVGPLMTPAFLKAAVDGYRQIVADKCAWTAAAETAGNALT